MKKIISAFIFSLSISLMSSSCFANDSWSNVGASIGQSIGAGIANSSKGDDAHVIPTEEYKNDTYNAGKIKNIFLTCIVPKGFEQFVEYPYAAQNTDKIVKETLEKKGFKVESFDSVWTKISQENNINLSNLSATNPAEVNKMLSEYIVRNFDATCFVNIWSYRMIPGQASQRAEATLNVVIKDPKLNIDIYSYQRQFIRADLLLAHNDPNDMVKKISNSFVNSFSKKVNNDKSKER